MCARSSDGPSSTPRQAGSTLLEVNDLVVHFPLTGGLPFRTNRQAVQAVDGISFDIAQGETLGLVGESGCGKSTTGRAIVCLTRPTGGSVRLDGQELIGLPSNRLRALRHRFQMVFQDPYSSLNPRMKIGSIIAEPLRAQQHLSSDDYQARVREMLQVVGLPATAADRYPHEFSGGQRQRVGIARSLIVRPELVVADEPVSALDVSIRAQIINLLRKLQNDFNVAYLFIAHDLSVVRQVSNRVAVMYLGRIVELGPAREIYRGPLHPYTIALMSAAPVADPVVESRRQRIILPGDLPSAISPPSGCRFHNRCWLRQRLGNPAACVDSDPPLRPLAPGHIVACHFSDKLGDHPAPLSGKIGAIRKLPSISSVETN